MDENLTSYGGLCCSDCIPSHAEFFSHADSLDEMLEDLQFGHYADLKTEVTEDFRNYPEFVSVLRQIRKLRCSGPCRSGGGKAGCGIRKCAQEKGYSGCWQCSTRRGCPLLDRLRTIHPHIDEHLDLIRTKGPGGWFPERTEHYRWQVKERK
jgi:hypothetical protein